MTVLLERPDLISALTSRTAPRTPARSPRRARRGSATRTRPAWRSSGADSTVPLAGGGRIAYANLDHGASAPALPVVKDIVDELLSSYASVHRGAGWHSRVCTELYEGAREPVRDFVGGRPDDAVIFTRNTTDSFNLLAHCLPARTTVVVFETEHHAALLPWAGRADDPVDRAGLARRRRSLPSTTRCAAARRGRPCW